MPDFRPPVERVGTRYKVQLGDEEVTLLVRLFGELRELLRDEGPDAGERLRRLFPPARTDDPEQEAEYQRLMRDELVTSRLMAIDQVQAALTSGEELDDERLTAFMQSLNAVRLVLGTMLGISDDDDDDDIDVDEPEYHLYDFLSWVLEWTVRALADGLPS